ncbi:uncharacterized protein LOC129583405 [Paramacrobiotus metropolitanus]|uniref:uncharacterized protein LOC129583405 n=1 Tax=Paramacrobiotus metropolitanus TaxID=2943436 RepID=UPI002446443C|nr:uncharacterized protein LOC129583405 [Paramacrobiotus metropolitanus]
MTADITLSAAAVALAPATWKYGALLTGVVITQILGMLWYSPLLFGNIWLDYHPEIKKKISAGPVNFKAKMVASAIGDMVFALFLSLFFHPNSLESAIVMTVGLEMLNLLMQWQHIVWVDQKLGCLVIDQGYDTLSIFIKLLTLAYVPF